MDIKYILITIMIGLIIMPFASAIEDATSISSTDAVGGGISSSEVTIANTGNIGTSRISATNNDASICIAYLEKNKLSNTPKITCARLMKKDLNCIEFLKGKNVQTPAVVCNKLLGTPQVTISNTSAITTSAGIAQTWRTQKINAYAQRTPSIKANIEALSEQERKTFMYLSRARQEELLKLNKEEMLKKINTLKLVKVKTESIEKKRIISKEKLIKSERDYNLAKENYQKVNNEYKNKYSNFVKTKERLRMCNNSNSTECEEARENIQKHAVEVVIKSAERLITHLNKIKYQIQNAEEMNETRAEEIIANIDSAIEELEAAKKQAEEATTKEEVKEVAQTIRDIWAKTKHAELIHRARLIHAKTWGLIKRATHLEEIMDRSVSAMNEAGIEVDAINEKIDKYSELMVNIEENYKQAEQLIKEAHQIRTDNLNLTEEQKEEVKTKMTEAQSIVKSVHKQLREAHKLVIEIVRDIRKAGGKIIRTPSTNNERANGEQYTVVETEE
ncbi:MAG: hypothetical protein KAQ92_02735 [Candidatus Aenigmarchaeota archaeon]|nr:hypothetical protein [Candidatus Aenigmarchaeota archaeon]